MTSAVGLLALAATSMSLSAQVKVQARQPPPQGKASIEGTVVDAVTRGPVKKASVMLGGRASLNAITDASGHFAFRELPEGQYIIQAQSENYRVAQFGIETGQPLGITLAGDDHKRDVTLSLTPGASVRGRIFDEEGNPIPRCSVNTMQFHESDAGRTLGGTGSSQTDDKGEYQIRNIPTGKHYIVARCMKSVLLPHAFIRRTPTMDLPMLVYPAQFYPGVPDPAGATRVEALPGADIVGIDIRMSPATGVAVRGRINPLLPDKNLHIMFEPKDPLRRGWQRQGVSANQSTGEFRIPNVLPGSYELVAAASGDGPLYFAKTSLEVGAASPEPLNVSLAPVPPISGTISIEGDIKVPVNSLKVMMNPLDGQLIMGPPPRTDVQSDGTFTLNSVSPGRWRLVVNGAPGYLKSVTRGDQEVSPGSLEIGPAAAPLKIVISTKFAQIDAAISVPPSSPTPLFGLLWPARSDSGFPEQTFGINPQGHSVLTVPPGRYYACAAAIAQPWMIMQNRALRKALESRCEAVDVPEGGRASAQMPLISAEDLKRLAEELEE